MTYRDVFQALKRKGASQQDVRAAAELIGFDGSGGLDSPVPETVRQRFNAQPSPPQPFPQPDTESPGGPVQLRSLSPGMPTVAGVGERGLTPVEQISFSEEEADLGFGAPLSEPTQGAPSVASETSQFADAVRDLDVSLARTPSFQGALQQQQTQFERDRLPLPRALGQAERAIKRSVGEMIDFSQLDEPAALELARTQAQESQQSIEDREPNAVTRAVAQSMLQGRTPRMEDIALAGVGDVIEAPIEYASDVAGTVLGSAVGVVEPVVAGLTGVAASMGIGEESYDAAVTRMEQTMLDTSRFYDSKLDDSITSNMRSNMAEMQSGMFQIMEALFAGAITEEELKAANAIDRFVAGFSAGRTLGSQMTEGAIAAFALLMSDPSRAIYADPVGSFLTIVPILKAAKAGRLAVDMSKLPEPTLALIDKSVGLYDQAINRMAESMSPAALDALKELHNKANEAGAYASTGLKELQAKATRALSQEGYSVEPAQTRAYESIFREPERQAAAVKSAGVEFARETRRATERGEVPIPQTVDGSLPLRSRPVSTNVDDAIPSRPQDVLGEPTSDIFAPDDIKPSLSREREFEVFRAGVDPLTEEVSLRPTTRTQSKRMRKELQQRYAAQGADKKSAASKAKVKAEKAAERGVYKFKRVDLDAARQRIFKTLGPRAKRIVDEMGGTSILKKDGKGAGVVDLGSDEFLEAMGEAIDINAANIMSSAALRGKVSKALINKYSQASESGVSLKTAQRLDRLVHDAASRLPADLDSLGSSKAYDIDVELPNGTKTSLLKLARGVVADDKKLAGLVFEQSMVSVAERLSQTVRQRRRQRGWLQALGGKGALKKSARPTEKSEALELAERWIADKDAGRQPSLPIAFRNDPTRVYKALEQLPEDVLSKLPPTFWARFKKGKNWTPMSKDLAEYVGLVDMPLAMQSKLRAVQVDAPFKSFDDMQVLYIPKHLASAIELMKKSDEWRMSMDKLAQFERSFKGNLVARNIGSLLNAASGNILYQMVRRGDPFIFKKMADSVAMYTKWRAGKLNAKDAAMIEAIDRTGALGSTYVKSELNKAYGEGAGGIATSLLGRYEAGRQVNKAIELQESGFSWTDSGAKLEDAIHNYRQFDKYKGMLDDGDWMQVRVGPAQSVRIYKDGDRFRLDKPSGRVLSDAQMRSITARASVYPGTKAFFDYNDPSRAARLARSGGMRGSTVLTVVVNPYWTWQNKAMTIPGVQKGLAGEVLTNGIPVLTNNKRIKTSQAMSQAEVAFRRAALVQGARNTLGDREYHEALRDSAQYKNSRHQRTVATFRTLANPAYIASKQWTSSTFLEPFDNLLGVVDALISSPDDPSSKMIRKQAQENKDLKAADNLYAGYDDMSMMFGSLDPNNEFELESVFPTITPGKRQGRASETISQAFASADKSALRDVPEEYRRGVKRVRKVVRDAWGGKKSAIASAAALAGLTGGILDRAWGYGKEVLGGETAGYAVDRFENAVGPMLFGGTAYKVGKAFAGRGSVFRYLPPDADYNDTFEQMWTAITGLGKVHLRAAGKPNSSMNERKGILDQDITRLKTAMRKSIRDTLGADIFQLNKEIASPKTSDEKRQELIAERANSLKHWRRIMGSSNPGEKKASKGGLINTIIEDYKKYILEGWRRAPQMILTPGEGRKNLPKQSQFDLF